MGESRLVSDRYDVEQVNGLWLAYVPDDEWMDAWRYFNQFSRVGDIYFHPDEYDYCPWCRECHAKDEPFQCIKHDLFDLHRVQIPIGRIVTNKYDVFQDDRDYYVRVPQDVKEYGETRAFLKELDAYLKHLDFNPFKDICYFDADDFVVCPFCRCVEPKNKRFECVGVATPLP